MTPSTNFIFFPRVRTLWLEPRALSTTLYNEVFSDDTSRLRHGVQSITTEGLVAYIHSLVHLHCRVCMFRVFWY